MDKLLARALTEVLVCPYCKGDLFYREILISCKICKKEYSFVEGIPVFLDGKAEGQEDERLFRDGLDFSYLSNESDIYKKANEHHSVSLMRDKAKSFISNFKFDDWIVDIGIGFGCHWKDQGANKSCILGIDFSIENLKVARKLLGNSDRVLLICADAARLPFRDKAISGVWSVQTFQHFPDIVFEKVKKELSKSLREKFIIEVIDLNSSLIRKVGKLFLSGRVERGAEEGKIILKRRDAKGLIKRWRNFDRPVNIKINYSELFFHPPYFVPKNYPVLLEKIMVWLPHITKYISRQIDLVMISK